jgi:ferritin-like metal-binding protein YciE
MADPGTLQDAFIDELRDAYDAEKQLTKALPKMARAASSPDLRVAFEHHLEETRGQIERLEQVFESLDERVRARRGEGSGREALGARRGGHQPECCGRCSFGGG